MKLKRLTAVILTLCLVLCLVPVTTYAADTTTIEYRYDGKYVYNWGTREETATFLSPMAEEFYEDNNITYEELAALTGSGTVGSVPNSALYKTLQTLMESNHTHETDYGETRYQYKYTDCQQNGQWENGKISSFYSGNTIGPGWDYGRTWNREHTWPNSKGNASGNGENDIMMLRPTAKSENGSRSNRAYGESAGYYFPNQESGGEHDVRGDVARIMLYTYVRWECTNTGYKYNPNDIFGTKGVIESREVLLEWAEADPVDTWELGRNDAVQAITGTRNVFVDYPELIFVLFSAEIPEDMTTPSGHAAEETICPHANSFAINAVAATCVLPGNTAGRYCNDCHTYYDGYTVLKELGHSWTGADCNVQQNCDRCGVATLGPVGHRYDDKVDGICNYCNVNRENVETRVVTHMFRMYNPNTGEHFYTGSEVERDNLIAAGWQHEGVGFTFPANSGAPVYRLFQPSTGEHLYTMDEVEKDRLMAEGWNYEGIAFNSAYNTEAVQHRLHNPNATVGAYHFTFSEEEMNNLIAAGWEYQGIGWYSCWK